MEASNISSSNSVQQRNTDETSRLQQNNPQNPAVEEDAAMFKKLLQEGNSQKLSLGELEKLLKMLQSQKGNESLIQAVLGQIQAQQGGLAGVAGAQSTASAGLSNSHLQNLVDKIASQIYVSKGELDGGKSSVLITFKPDVLPQTQVLLSRSNGVLNVAFQSNLMDSTQLLTQNQTQLQQALNQRLQEPVAVTVNGQGGVASEQNEGRSRGQYFAEPENDPEMAQSN
jgi:hypothetical protein